MSWNGYVDGVLRPMQQAREEAAEERARVIKTLRIAADRIEKQQPRDPVAWLRKEAAKLERKRR